MSRVRVEASEAKLVGGMAVLEAAATISHDDATELAANNHSSTTTTITTLVKPNIDQTIFQQWT